MYETPSKTYRDLIKEKGLSLNREGTQESQTIIRDALIDQAVDNAQKEFCLHDRCILDNLVYTLWLSEKGKITDNEFIADSFNITRETLKFYDIIFWLPISDKSPVNLEESENRDINTEFRFEINNIFNGVFENYKKNTGLIFSFTDAPVMIDVTGDELFSEKTNLISEYLNDEGGLQASGHVFQTLSDFVQEDNLINELLNQLEK